jgi:sulfate transport system ATP-binding protein
MRKWLRELQQKIQLTSVFVTHDQDEALELADRVAVMEQGELVQVGSPQDVYDRPGSPFVYDFLGGANRVACRVAGGRVLVGDDVVGQVDAADAQRAALYVRAHDFEVLPDGQDAGLRGTVAQVGQTGGLAHLDVQLSTGEVVEVELPRWALGPGIARGAPVRLQPRHFGVFGLG